MKTSNALRATSLILLINQTVQQPAFAYDLSDGYESGGSGGPNGPGPNDTGTANPGTSNNPGNSHEVRNGGYSSKTPAPNASGNPYGASHFARQTSLANYLPMLAARSGKTAKEFPWLFRHKPVDQAFC